MIIRRRRRRQRGTEAGPTIDSRVSKRRDFRLERLEKKAEVIKQRKWVFLSIMVIVVAAAAVAMKVM